MDAQEKDTLESYKGMSVGKIFQKARMDQGLEIAQIAEHLNIGSTHLEAIEADDKTNMPPQVYAVGFVRAYADVLGLDSDKMAYLFKIQSYGEKKTEEQKAITTKRHGETISTKAIVSQKLDNWTDNIAPFLLMVAGLFLLVAILWFFVWLVWPEEQVESRPRAPPVSEVIIEEEPMEPEELVQTVTAELPEPEPIEPAQLFVKPGEGATAYGADMIESDLVLKADAESWVEIRNARDRKLLLSQTLQAGDVFYVGKETDIIMTTGNAGGLEVFLDGQSLGKMGDNAQVIRMRVLSAEALRLQNAQ